VCRRHSIDYRESAGVRRQDRCGFDRVHKRGVRHHLLGFPVRRRVLDLPRGLSPELRRSRTEQGICGVLLGSTNVVLRDGRQRRLWRADVAQLVAHHLAKVRVAGSNPVIRSNGAVASTPAVEWPSGEATACKAVHTGSIPVSTSSICLARLAQRESASLTRKRSLVQSQYRAPRSTCGNVVPKCPVGLYGG
jgi:hypothetical protein